MLGMVFAAVLVSASPYWDSRPIDEVSAKHMGTGMAAGMAVMGTCSTYFVVRSRLKNKTPRLSTLACYGSTLLLSSLTYGYKEMVYDAKVYGNGKVPPKGYRDLAEGVGGSAVGALVFLPVATW
jgi:hypothetical protein